jgi:hypothetical protein
MACHASLKAYTKPAIKITLYTDALNSKNPVNLSIVQPHSTIALQRKWKKRFYGNGFSSEIECSLHLELVCPSKEQ